MEWRLPPGWSRRLGPQRVLLWAARLLLPPPHRSALLRREWIANVPTPAVETRSPEYREEGRNSIAGHASGEASLSSRIAWHRRRAASWRRGTRVSALVRVLHRSWRIGWRKFPCPWPRSTCAPR